MISAQAGDYISLLIALGTLVGAYLGFAWSSALLSLFGVWTLGWSSKHPIADEAVSWMVVALEPKHVHGSNLLVGRA